MTKKNGFGTFLMVIGVILIIIGAFTFSNYGWTIFLIGIISGIYGRDIRVGIEDSFLGHLSGKKYREYRTKNNKFK